MKNHEQRLIKMGIPEGDYCYTILSINEKTGSMRVKYCPFWYGKRPDGGCLIFGWDAGLGDACKSCGWLYDDVSNRLEVDK